MPRVFLGLEFAEDENPCNVTQENFLSGAKPKRISFFRPLDFPPLAPVIYFLLLRRLRQL